MDYSHTEDDEAFRTELVDWLDENLPKFLAEWADNEDDAGAGPATGPMLAQMEQWVLTRRIPAA